MDRREFLGAAVAGVVGAAQLSACRIAMEDRPGGGKPPVRLSPLHLEAVNRRRRVAKNFDVLLIDPDTYPSIEAILKSRFAFIDDPDSCIDSVWWNWGEGNVAAYPSKILPTYNQPAYQRWIREGVDIVRIFQDETRKRGLEVFFSERMNGSDNDPQFIPGRGTFIDDMHNQNRIPLKQQNPDWIMVMPWNPNGIWNYAVEGVRDYVFRKMEEVATVYEFDGIELDFARMCPIFPEGQAWENHSLLTDLIRRIRKMTLEVERRRGRAFLLAARVPENLLGCHFDGMDVGTWIKEQLVDILALGCRNFEVDLVAFRQLAEGLPTKLLGVIDDHHSSDGYCAPPIEVLRGVWSNWYHQGADGIQTFNFKYGPDPGELHWPMHQQAFREMGGAEVIRHLDKTFVVQRRGGGHGKIVMPNPEDWSTPRFMYSNTNMLEALPAALDNSGRVDTLLTLNVGDDIPSEADRVADLRLRLLLNDPAAARLPKSRKHPPVMVRDRLVPERVGGPGPEPHWTSGMARGIEKRVEVRINNLNLGTARVEAGGLEFKVKPDQLALGKNLVGVRVADRPAEISEEVLIEKLELMVRYQEAKSA